MSTVYLWPMIFLRPPLLRAISIGGQETAPSGMAFNTDGTKMYVIGTTGDDVNEYSLSTAFDVSSATYVQRFSIDARRSYTKV